MVKEALFQRFFNSVLWNKRAIHFSDPNNGFGEWEVNDDGDIISSDIAISKAERLTVVYNCINIIAQTVGAFPFITKRETDSGKFDAKDHPVYSLLKNKPNRFMTSMNFWMVVVKHLLTRGNSYVFIDKDSSGDVRGLYPLDPRKMLIEYLDGEIRYKYQDLKTPLEPEELLHFKLYSDDGILGISPISHNSNTLKAHEKQNHYSNKMLGEKPPGYLTDKTVGNVKGGKQGAERRQQNVDQWKQQIRKNGIPYLDGDIAYTPLMITPDEAQYIDTRKFTKLEIMAMYRTPPELHQIYENSNRSINEGTSINFGKYCLTPIVTCIEQECGNKLFNEPLYVKANMMSLYRSDLKTAGEYFKAMVGAGIYNADEVRSMEDKNPQPDGQGSVYYIQSAFMPKGSSEQFWSGKSGDTSQSSPEEEAKKLSTDQLYKLYLSSVEGGDNG